MLIPPNTPATSLPMLRRIAQFENAVSGNSPSAALGPLALGLWEGQPGVRIFEGVNSRPRSVLLTYSNSTMWFTAGSQTALHGWLLVSGYDYSAGRIPESEDDNTYLGFTLWNWWNENVRDLFFNNPGPRLVIGHSAGGAFCHDLVWRRLNRGQEVPNYVTFGAPRAFGLRACTLIEQNRLGWRYMLPTDPVTHIWPRNFEFPEMVFSNPSAVAWQHPTTDGIVIQGDSFVAGTDSPQIGNFPTLDIGSWLWDMQDNPNHSMPAYLSEILRITRTAESALAGQPIPAIDPQLAPNGHTRLPPVPELQAAVTVTQARQAQQVRSQFVAANSPPEKLIKLFTWRRRGRKYEVLCNGHVFAWGFRRHSAAECARAGNDLVFRMISQSLVIDPQTLQDSLEEFWNGAVGLSNDLLPLMRTLRTPLAIY